MTVQNLPVVYRSLFFDLRPPPVICRAGTYFLLINLNKLLSIRLVSMHNLRLDLLSSFSYQVESLPLWSVDSLSENTVNGDNRQ